ncbi:Heterogeneous nuclear ribonucleoprotein K [Fasciola gigantica]|uniref:Heterogeneous nuclear ribonucleoprotein K n=1 Tax=Fasciola gigantica TaxID=46835 RepID=A0A504YLM1_FASGI|nr:Heterogeneous nuclear ribonucleoprotein K [Fasciola gigantica]
MVAEPDNAISCLKSVVEAVESAPPRGRREDYDAANFSEADALNYGGWLSREAVQALSQGMPLSGPGGMPPMGYGMGGPYMMGGDMGCGMGPMPGGMGSMGGGMGPMPGGPMPPMGGARPPMSGGRGGAPGSRGPRSGTIPGGPRPMAGGPPGGPSPVPPPGGPRGVGASSTGNPANSYGGPTPYGGQSSVPQYEAPGGYDNGGMYGGMDQQNQPASGNQTYGSGTNALSSGSAYGAPTPYGNAPRGSGDMSSGTG